MYLILVVKHTNLLYLLFAVHEFMALSSLHYIYLCLKVINMHLNDLDM